MAWLLLRKKKSILVWRGSLREEYTYGVKSHGVVFFFTPIVIQTQIMPFYPAMIYKEIVLKKVTCAMKHGINSVFICTGQILIEPVAPLRMGL